jgi:hypothetical protein
MEQHQTHSRSLMEKPAEFGIGLAKGVGKLPSDLANLAAEGIKNQLGANNYATL